MNISKYITIPALLLCGLSLEAQDAQIFWSSASSPDTIYRSNLDGSNIQLTVETSGAAATAVDNKNQVIYWLNIHTSGIERSNFDGSSRQTVVAADVSISDIDFDVINQKLYYFNYNTELSAYGLNRVNPDGSGAEVVYTLQVYDSPNSFTVDARNQKAYLIIDSGDRSLGSNFLITVDLENNTQLGSAELLIHDNYDGLAVNTDGTGLFFGYGSSIKTLNPQTLDIQTVATVEDHINRFVPDFVNNQLFLGQYRSPDGVLIGSIGINQDNYSEIIPVASMPTLHTDTMAIFNLDTDGDAVADALDFCATDKDKIIPGNCGCAVEETDADENNNAIIDCRYNQEALYRAGLVEKRINRASVVLLSKDLSEYINAHEEELNNNNPELDLPATARSVLRLAKDLVATSRATKERKRLKRKLLNALESITQALVD